ncbi:MULTISPECIES: hypothetical protein [unclassified Microcoleus]|uniref:hypothetical protein n=1 Tax=unclassified Microcoleus TaxID=2642155 RepID=UPI001D3AB9E1|nr:MULTISPECIES: hypothetical protein [unclassified Microcoleus]MCC3506553.1 hypothetical protein [Microcoleus sp. PH2017_19_SFW_U_A]MCC3439412.1 hypothetical protein [Microcoleus sp. PH2017_05_CCC_O_A]MCC3476385.1 hypothetical protein [Microcoleus sp. PH2017_13_LAR_U_A]MCC3488814.1 hypothetical protein [Microcoleus sp. PH2017_14_LAR_D_A]MCC3501166.1 hypothetical protein [Microcoleus sp. PH2017_15_JOR_U_A]
MMSEAPNNTDEELSPSVLTLDDILKRLAHLEAIVEATKATPRLDNRLRKVASFNVCISVFDSLTAIALEREITRSELLRHIVETWLAATTNNGRPKVTKSKPVGFDKKSKTPTDTITELEF